MASIDPYSLNLHDLFIKAVMFRLKQADPNCDDSITISQTVFDQLVSVLDAFKQLSSAPEALTLEATVKEGTYSVRLKSDILGEIVAQGRTLPEAIINAKRKMGARLNEFID